MVMKPIGETVPRLRWERDSAGDTLWSGETFLGCIYNRDGLSSFSKQHGWRALEGDDLVFVGDVLPTPEQPDARLGARALLEAHVSGALPLPTAKELLHLTTPRSAASATE